MRRYTKHGAAVDFESVQGYTALIHAAEAGQAEAVTALVHQGAAVDLVTAQGYSALTVASRRGKMNSVAALLACGAVQSDDSRRMLMESIIASEQK